MLMAVSQQQKYFFQGNDLHNTNISSTLWSSMSSGTPMYTYASMLFSSAKALKKEKIYNHSFVAQSLVACYTRLKLSGYTRLKLS